MTTQSCLYCEKYVDCRRRINGMRKVKKNHPTNSHDDIWIRCYYMDKIAADCPEYEKGV